MAKKIKKVISKKKRVARKIQGWFPEGCDLDMIASKLQFIGLSLTSEENLDGIPKDALIGAGCILLELSEKLEVLDKGLSDFHLRLVELRTGRTIPELHPQG
jgi:hypothetical protein